jgi:hypothetical protein
MPVIPALGRFRKEDLKLEFFIFLMGLGFELSASIHTCKAGALLLKPHLQSILLWLFWRWDLVNYLPRLASNCNPPNLPLK